VKVVTDVHGRALYFSRAPVPHGGPFRVHVGIYAFAWESLQRVAQLVMPPGLEGERLEQLAWMSHGEAIRVVDVPEAGRSVDTRADLAWARDALATSERRG
jgi:3-deoxy-manno-octulosonate cytidylyltransferase (CMP-KDO synthetase)